MISTNYSEIFSGVYLMITIETIASIQKENLLLTAETLTEEDVSEVEWLLLKDDDSRYKAFLLLKNRSDFSDDVYAYWDTFRDKLRDGNSYQRSIGLMLISENVKWDAERRMDGTIDRYLALLKDEKPITVRQCIQSLSNIVEFRPDLGEKIAGALMSLDLAGVKETMRKLILLDILNILLAVRKTIKKDEIESYLFDALLGEMLDGKAKKQIEAQMRG